MKKYIVIVFFIFLPAWCMAEENDLKRLFSLNIKYLITGLKNSGGGIGVHYERLFFQYVSLKGGLGHMVFKTSLDGVGCTSINLSLFLHVYPFGEGLNKWYFGLGNGTDFMSYFGSAPLPETGKDTVIYLTPCTGYKLFCFKYIICDFNIGYRFNIANSNNYYTIKEYLNPGVQFNVSVNILLSKIW